MQFETIILNNYQQTELLRSRKRRVRCHYQSSGQMNPSQVITMRQNTATSPSYESQNAKNRSIFYKIFCSCFLRKPGAVVVPESSSKYVIKNQDATFEVSKS